MNGAILLKAETSGPPGATFVLIRGSGARHCCRSERMPELGEEGRAVEAGGKWGVR